MIRSPFQSGTHIAERICWIRIDCPASKRPSASASDVSTATRSLTTVSTIVCENGCAASIPELPRWRASVGTGWPAASRSTTTPRSTGRKSKRRSSTFPRISFTSRATISVLATCTRISKIFPRARGDEGRRPEDESLSLPATGETGSRLKSRLKSAMERTNVEVESPESKPCEDTAPSSRSVSVNVPIVSTSPGSRGAWVTNRPFTLMPFVEFWSCTTNRSPSDRITACRRETEKSFSTISFSLERPSEIDPSASKIIETGVPRAGL